MHDADEPRCEVVVVADVAEDETVYQSKEAVFAVRHTADSGGGDESRESTTTPLSSWAHIKHAFLTFGKFVGPGFMISVAYSKSSGCRPEHEPMLT